MGAKFYPGGHKPEDLQVSTEQGGVDAWLAEQPLLLELRGRNKQGLNLLVHSETRQAWIGIYRLKNLADPPSIQEGLDWN